MQWIITILFGKNNDTSGRRLIDIYLSNPIVLVSVPVHRLEKKKSIDATFRAADRFRRRGKNREVILRRQVGKNSGTIFFSPLDHFLRQLYREFYFDRRFWP